MFLFLLQSSFDVPLLDGFESAFDLFRVDPAFSVAWEISCLHFESEIYTDWLRLSFPKTKQTKKSFDHLMT